MFGEDIAILAGDSLLTLAFEVLSEASPGREVSLPKDRAIREISQAAGSQGMVGGQLLDITLSPDKVSTEIMDELIRKKTGALITVSLRVGGILGKATGKQMKALSAYGENIGFAFQIRDDILDSSQDVSSDRPFRPNSVNLWGLEASRRKLERSVQVAVNALRREKIQSEELVFLAELLLDLEIESKNE
jgi:geranylgeranyl diphosphate synthase type II